MPLSQAEAVRQRGGRLRNVVLDDVLADQLIRLNRFTHVREFFREVSARSRSQKVERMLSVTNSTSVVLADDQFAHRAASADLSNYKVALPEAEMEALTRQKRSLMQNLLIGEWRVSP